MQKEGTSVSNWETLFHLQMCQTKSCIPKSLAYNLTVRGMEIKYQDQIVRGISQGIKMVVIVYGLL